MRQTNGLAYHTAYLSIVARRMHLYASVHIACAYVHVICTCVHVHKIARICIRLRASTQHTLPDNYNDIVRRCCPKTFCSHTSPNRLFEHHGGLQVARRATFS